MKKLLTLAAILGMSISFVGCDAKKPEPKKDAVAPVAPADPAAK